MRNKRAWNLAGVSKNKNTKISSEALCPFI